MFSNNSIAKLWETTIYDNFTIVTISTSRKNADGRYETDFHRKVKFCGNAHKKAPKKGQRIKILSCGATCEYNKEQQVERINFVIFDYELLEKTNVQNDNSPKSFPKKNTVQQYPNFNEDLPF